MNILVCANLDADLLDDLTANFNVTFVGDGNAPKDYLLATLPEIDGVITSIRTCFDHEVLDCSERLRVVSNIAVGLDNIDVKHAGNRGIAICNTPGVLDTAVAEFTIALIMNLARGILDNHHFVSSGEWQKTRAGLTRDINGKVLGLIGMGRIGRRVATIAKALGMKVVYYQPPRDFEAEEAGIASFVERQMLFETADIISVHVPLTEETRASIGQAEFRAMKNTALFINTSRGQVVIEKDLVQALRDGNIAGAALDVMEVEPLPSDSPLLQLDNVLLQPHAASATVETRRAMAELAVRNLKAGLLDA